MGDNRTIHLATKEGTQSVNIDLEQDFDFLEVLSLRITQQEAYRIFCANYGVLVGKVKANGGYPIKNAKLSIFIPLDDVDSRNLVVRNVYPFETPSDQLSTGQRYNLLPRDKQLATPADHTPVGTFPSKYDIMVNETLLYVHEKYYKYTTTTNENGDYMFFGLPTGTQIVHMDVDLSDIGNNSVTPADLMNLGYSESLFESDAKFKRSNDLDQLAQIVGINKTVYIRPFWGDVDECEYGITRADFDTARFVFPKGYLIGSIYTDGPPTENNSFVPKSCWQESTGFASSGLGLRGGVSRIVRADSLRTPEEVASAGEVGKYGIIEACRLAPNGRTEYVGKWTTKPDGSFMIPLPLNLGKKVWDEDSQSWVDNDDEGFATFGDYRFKIYWESQGDGSNEQNVENYYDNNINTSQLILGHGGDDLMYSPRFDTGSLGTGDAYASLNPLGGGIWYGTFYNNKSKDSAKNNRGVLFLPNPYVDVKVWGEEEANGYTFFAVPNSLNASSAPFNMKDQFGNQLGRWSNYTRIRLSAYYTVAQYFNYVSDYDVAVPGRKPEGCFSEGILGAWYNGPGDSVYSTPNKPSVYGEDGPDWNNQSIGTNPWIISRSWVNSDEEIRQFPVNYIFNKYKRKDPRWQGIHLEGDEVYLKDYGGFISNYTTASLRIYSAFNMGADAAFSEQGTSRNANCYWAGVGNSGLRGNSDSSGAYCGNTSCCNPPQLLYCKTGACDCTNVCYGGGTISTIYCGVNSCFGMTDGTNDVIDGYWFTTARNFYHFDMDGASGNGNDLIFNSTINEWESTNHLDGCIGCMNLDTVWEDMANYSMVGRGGSIFNEDATPYSWVMPPGQAPAYDPNQGVDISGTLTYGNMRDTPSPLAKGSNKVTMVGDGVTENEGIRGNSMCGGFIAPIWGKYAIKARIPYGGADDCYAGVVGIHYCDTTRKNCDLNANWSYSAATSQFFNTGYDKQSVSWAGFAGNDDSTRSSAYSSKWCPSFITGQPALINSHCTVLKKNVSICGDDSACGGLGAYHQKGGGGNVSWELRLKEGMAVRLGVQPVAANSWNNSPAWCQPNSTCTPGSGDGGNLAIPSLAHDHNLCANGFGCGYVYLNMAVTHYFDPPQSELLQSYQREIGEPLHGSLYFPQYYVGINDDECCSRSNGDFEGWTNSAPEERHKVKVWEEFSLIYAGTYYEIDGTLNYKNYTTGQGDVLGGSPIRNGKYYNIRTIGNTDIVEITKEIPNFRLGPNQWANLDMNLPNTSTNLSSDYNYSLILNKSSYGPFFTNQDTQNWPSTYAGGMEELQNKNFAPYDWLDFRLAQQYPPQFDSNEVMQKAIAGQASPPVPTSWDWVNGNNWGMGPGKLIYPVPFPYYSTVGNLVESNYNAFKYNIQGFSQGGTEFPGEWPQWYSWLRPMPESWYSANSFWWKDIYTLSTEYKELDGETVGTYSPTTPWSAGETYNNNFGSQRTQNIGRQGWNATNLNAYPVRKYYYFGLRKDRWTALDELKDVLGNVQTV